MSLPEASELRHLSDYLAPGDRPISGGDWDGFTCSPIISATHPHFDEVYAVLWEEFGHKNELESRATLEHRLGWTPAAPVGKNLFYYQMMEIRRGEELVAVRDHTAIWHPTQGNHVVVHLSHALVLPPWRGSGIAGWLRAVPVLTARALASAAGLVEPRLTLCAEMEAWDAAQVDRVVRLKSYQKAGYSMVDPELGYAQPDFRTSDVLDSSGGAVPLPLCLVVRRVGHEGETSMPWLEVQHSVHALYRMYAVTMRARDMAVLWEWAERLPTAGACALVPPAQP